jgi:amino acid transporter
MGTFAGVFTPSILTILGIILFLRLGYVVGSGGLTQTFLVLGLSSALALVTSISLSAIATNIRVKGGGVYYLISRSLGSEYGGALGIVLFVAQSVSSRRGSSW